MKFGINFLLWTCFVDESYFPLFKKLKSLGYDGVEIPVDGTQKEHYKSMAQAIKDAGLEVTITTNGTANQDIGAKDSKIQQAGINHTRRVIEIAHILGAKLIAGPLHTAPSNFPANCPQEGEFERIVKNLGIITQEAEQADVRLALEILNRFEQYIANTMKQGYDIVSKIDSPYLGIHYDSHHMHYEENSIEEAIQDGGKFLYHCHWSESHRGILGTGQVNWQAHIKALKMLKSEWIVFEGFSDKVPGLKEAACRWRPLFSDELRFCRESMKFAKNLLNK